MKINIICTCCPLGCNLNIVKSDSDNKYITTGNRCPRGKEYALTEMTAPKRVVTSTVKITGGLYPVIPVKTEQPIPKEKIPATMQALCNVTVSAPIKIGDPILKNVADTGIAIVATKTDLGT